MTDQPCKFVWYELMTPDPDAAERFYKAVIGWNAHAATVGDEGYRQFRIGDVDVAGMMTLTDEVHATGVRPLWLGYVGVADVDAVVVQAIEAGGDVYKEATDIPGVGRFAMIADPHGGALMIIRGIGEGDRKDPPLPGYVAWRELMAGHGAEDYDFYAGLFGWTETGVFDLGAMGPYRMFATGGDAAMGAVMTKPDTLPRPQWNYYFRVDSVTAAAKRIMEAGGLVTLAPHAVPNGSWVLHGRDPQGASFALLSDAA